VSNNDQRDVNLFLSHCIAFVEYCKLCLKRDEKQAREDRGPKVSFAALDPTTTSYIRMSWMDAQNHDEDKLWLALRRFACAAIVLSST
jgi:hypothetical protein